MKKIPSYLTAEQQDKIARGIAQKYNLPLDKARNIVQLCLKAMGTGLEMKKSLGRTVRDRETIH